MTTMIFREQKSRKEHYDVAVVGGGMAGLCAALASARHGAETVLIHARPVLGGNASSEIRMHICGASESGKKPELEESGILYELMLENKYRNDYYNYSIWDMVLFQAAKEQPNLTLYLNTSMETCTNSGSRISSISCYQQTTETRLDISADIFIDCTGNATLGYLSGAEFRTGSEARSEFGEADAPERANNDRMGNTLLFKAVRRDCEVPFHAPKLARHFTEEELRYRPHSAVHNNSLGSDDYNRMTSFSASAVDYGYWWCELCGTGDDIIGDYEKIRDELVSCVYGVWDHLKNGGDHAAQNYDLVWVGMLPGMRESRRLVGDYILNENDILSARKFDDAVAYGGWAMDVHTAHGLYDFDKKPSRIIAFPGTYTIPYRSYYSRNIGNLMMAGRDISVSKMAFGSTRVMGTCAIGGQAAGTAAALCRKYGCLPRELNGRIGELQQLLMKDDCYLPGFANEDSLDLAKRAKITASSAKKACGAESVVNGVSRGDETENQMWVSDGLSGNGERLTLEFPEEQTVSQVRLTFDTNFHYSIKITLSDKRRRQQRTGVPAELVKDYTVTLWQGGQAVRSIPVSENHQRLNVLDFEPTPCSGITVDVTATNGAPDARIFEIRTYGPQNP